MQTINVETWEKFEEELITRNIIGEQCLFRGQKNSSWSLDTTLERRDQKHLRYYADYYRCISAIRPQIETFTDNRWGSLPGVSKVTKLSREYDKFNLMLGGLSEFPAYSYMAYLRHHGFPSPLLDWTRTPYVAAYFAFRDAAEGRVAIYIYNERPQRIKISSSNETQIHPLGPFVQTHRRHFLQQSTYTICWGFDINRGWYFAPHESVFMRNASNQDVLWKFTMPATERIKVLKKLDLYNLNAYSLFESEEALMETMSLRRIDFIQEVPKKTKNKRSVKQI